MAEHRDAHAIEHEEQDRLLFRHRRHHFFQHVFNENESVRRVFAAGPILQLGGKIFLKSPRPLIDALKDRVKRLANIRCQVRLLEPIPCPVDEPAVLMIEIHHFIKALLPGRAGRGLQPTDHAACHFHPLQAFRILHAQQMFFHPRDRVPHLAELRRAFRC